MTKKSPFLLLVLFLFQIRISYSQENADNLIDSFVTTMNNTGLSKSQTEKVRNLIIERNRLIAEDTRLQKELNAKYPFVFHDEVMVLMLSKSDLVEKMITASFLNDTTKRNYLHSYQGRVKQLMKV